MDSKIKAQGDICTVTMLIWHHLIIDKFTDVQLFCSMFGVCTDKGQMRKSAVI